MMICEWITLTSQCPLENDLKRQQICQIRYEKCWVVRPVFFKFVYFTRHSHVTRAESQSNCFISQTCGPPGFHLMFIFLQMEPKTYGPPGFLFWKPDGLLVFFPCQICSLLCLFLSGHCDVREPSTRIPSSRCLSTYFIDLRGKYTNTNLKTIRIIFTKIIII